MKDKYTRENLKSTVEELISMNVIPIINENDVVASPPGMDQDLAGVSKYFNRKRRQMITCSILFLSELCFW